MKNTAHSILVSAIANHGEKLATSGSYCSVYLAGHLVDYPTERQLLLALMRLELPAALIAYRQHEIIKLEIYAAISALKEKPLHQSDLAWGVDAWAASLLLSKEVRQDIRIQCFPSVSTQLNSGLESVSEDQSHTPAHQEPKIIKRKVLPFSVAASLVGLVVFQVSGSYFLTEKNQPETQPIREAQFTTNTLETLDKSGDVALIKPATRKHVASTRLMILENPNNHDHANSSVASVRNADFRPSDVMQSESFSQARDSLTELTSLKLKQHVEKADFEVVLINEPVTQKQQSLSLADTPTPVQKNKRLNADIENFLMQRN